jgi:hypothetical protein
MIDFLTRLQSGDLEVRSEGRTVAGIVCPFDSPTEVSDWGTRYTESFARGAFAEAVAKPSKVKFLGQHDRQAFPLGTVVNLREDALGLYGEFKFSKTRAADDALELARDGAVDGFSVGFRSISPAANAFPKAGETVVRKAVRLSEVSLVTFPAYNDARVSEIRSEVEQHLADRLERLEAALATHGLHEEIELVEPEVRSFGSDPRSRDRARRLAARRLK